MTDSSTTNLFDVFDEPALVPERSTARAAVKGPFASVAIEQSVDRTLDYAIPLAMQTAMQVGQRVRVPLGRGNKAVHGYVVEVRPDTTFPDPTRIKSVLAVDDRRVLVPPTLMRLAQWMSRYYVAPLGLVLESIIPSAVKKRTGVGHITLVSLNLSREAAQAALEKTRAPKRRAVLARLLQLEDRRSIELLALARESNVTPPTVRKLAKLGWVTLRSEVDLPSLTADFQTASADEREIALNDAQRQVFDALLPKLSPADAVYPENANSPAAGPPPDAAPPPAAADSQPSPAGPALPAGFSVNLLLGVTGSGKTEIYLQAIRRIVDQGRQAIVLVPEIALTPQTTRRFLQRFKRVAVLHSGLSATARHKFWQQIATGQADVIVGARSAVFAPAPRLGMIVVDEEHEASYKQDHIPRYHGRDVAVKRAQLENVPILLGSATPSLEMYERVRRASAASAATASAPANGSAFPNGSTSGGGSLAGLDPRPSYTLLRLSSRVRGLAMPHVEVIDMKQEVKARRGVNLFSQRLEYLLTNTVAQQQQAILLLNRRGYSNFVHCPSCQHVMTCKFCDKTLTYHRSGGDHALTARSVPSAHTGQLHCHYCLAVNPLPTQCPQCGKLLSLFGLGTQRVEEEMQRKFPNIRFARVDSDSMRNAKDYEELLARFARREIDVLLGTQMIAKGLDYPNVTLVGVISGDTALALPDFRAAERTFQLITQVAGRAGRGDLPGRVVLQTFLPDDPAIQSAIKQDFTGFAERELVSRKEVGLPPFARMVRIVLRDEDVESLQQSAEELAGEAAIAAQAQTTLVDVKGPMPCAVGRIAGYFRYQIVLQSVQSGPLQRVLASLRERGLLSRTERIAVDVDPVSLL